MNSVQALNLKICEKMLNRPTLSTALLNDDPIERVFCPGDLKTSVCCFVSDLLALQIFDQERDILKHL